MAYYYYKRHLVPEVYESARRILQKNFPLVNDARVEMAWDNLRKRIEAREGYLPIEKFARLSESFLKDLEYMW